MRRVPFVSKFLFAVVACLAALYLSGCSSAGSGNSGPPFGVTGRVVVFGPDGASAKPVAMCAYDGATLFAFGEAQAVAELYISATGGAVFPPVGYGDGRAICRRRGEHFEWKGDASGPWPTQVQSLLKPGEAEQWGVTFFEASSVQPAPIPEQDDGGGSAPPPSP